MPHKSHLSLPLLIHKLHFFFVTGSIKGQPLNENSIEKNRKISVANSYGPDNMKHATVEDIESKTTRHEIMKILYGNRMESCNTTEESGIILNVTASNEQGKDIPKAIQGKFQNFCHIFNISLKYLFFKLRF